MFFMAEHSSEYREFLHNYDDMDPDRQTKAVMAIFAIRDQVDMMLKLNLEGLETGDNLRYIMDAFVGHMSTIGGNKFWKAMSNINLYGDNVLNAVNERLDKMEVPNNDFINAVHWLKPDKSW